MLSRAWICLFLVTYANLMGMSYIPIAKARGFLTHLLIIILGFQTYIHIIIYFIYYILP